MPAYYAVRDLNETLLTEKVNRNNNNNNERLTKRNMYE